MNRKMIENMYKIDGEITYLEIVNNKRNRVITKFNTVHFEKVKKWKWYHNSNLGNNEGYIYGYRKNNKGEYEYIFLHRLIMDVEDKDLVVDHINRETLNNLNSNLRVCTKLENNKNRSLSRRNTTGYTGVYFYKRYNKYVSSICANYKNKHLGYFDNIEDAVLARKQAEKELFDKEFAV